MSKSSTLKLLLLFSIPFALVACQQKPIEIPVEPTVTQEESVTPEVMGENVDTTEHAETIELTATEDGQTALELTQANVEVETNDTDFGVLVNSINGVSANQQYYWALYVNGDYAQTGASQVVLNEGDTIKWVYEEIQGL